MPIGSIGATAALSVTSEHASETAVETTNAALVFKPPPSRRGLTSDASTAWTCCIFFLIATVAVAVVYISRNLGSSPAPAYDRSSVASFAMLQMPSACAHWLERCRNASAQVAEAAARDVEFLQARFFSSETCAATFSCEHRQLAWSVPSLAYAPRNTSTAQAAHLVLHLPGTGTSSLDQEDFTATAARAGFHVLSLSYSSWPFAVANADAYCMASSASESAASDCSARLHESVVSGSVAHPLWPVPPSESIRTVALAALQTIGWQQFLLADGGGIDWRKVVISGHSQGASHAAYMSSTLPLAAAVLLSGPQEIVAAAWIRSATTYKVTRRTMFAEYEQCGETPYFADRYCGVYRRGAGLAHGILYRNCELMNLTVGVVGNDSFFMQNYVPTNLYGPNPDATAYHDSNAFNFAPTGVKVLWQALFVDLV